MENFEEENKMYRRLLVGAVITGILSNPNTAAMRPNARKQIVTETIRYADDLLKGIIEREK